ncbi:MAG: hypothetical protein IPK59_00905 [Rhodospirillaceae bacterium]|nr:hypothetical protein [Rhodospirillaceae bacterium]
MNESRDVSSAGAVSVFRSAGEACRYLEHWWVENSEGFAFSATGHHLVLGVDSNGSVIVTATEPHADGGAIVLSWLSALAESVLEARRVRATQGKSILGIHDESGRLPRTIEGLVAYVGFDD